MGTTSIAIAPDQLTPEWLTHVLKQGGTLQRAQVTSHQAKVIGEGAGFMGQLAQIKLGYDTPEPGAPASVIAKFPAAAPENRQIAMFFRFYEREVRFYETIGRSLPLRIPRCYYSAFDPSNGDYVLLLEDLAPASVGDQIAGCSGEHVRVAVRELAKLQAQWWRSPELEQLDWMPSLNADWYVEAVEQGYDAAWRPFCEFAAANLNLTPELRVAAERFGKSIAGIMNRFGSDLPTTIVHGDYRLDNMFFASPQGGPEFAVIDWQIASRGGGVFDVAYFVTGTLSVDERRAREREIVKLYHEMLVENGVTGYTLEQCWEDYRLSVLFLLVYSVIAIGSVDMANERGLDLFTKISTRTLAAVDDLKAYELMD